MTLFHGSYSEVRSPAVMHGRDKVDFGRGFYLTELRDQQSRYDIVEGGVANDNVIDTVELYENGDITAEQALGQLVYKKVNHQIAILNQRIVDECLRFGGSEEVPDAQ